MKKLPTDLSILDAIYQKYYDTFAEYQDGDTSRQAKIYVPIDIVEIARRLKVDGDIVFGRLYYHFEEKFGYVRDDEDGSQVHFFAFRLGEEINCVNFPLMASVLAELKDSANKYRTAMMIALASLTISIIAVFISSLSIGLSSS